MAFDSLVMSIAILIIIVDIPLMVLIALDRLGILRIFGSKHDADRHRTEHGTQRIKS
ncbi:MAG: hypothetical protein ABSE82_02380 [Nitrososphaerales archaeon]|jgi:hypothetical protein